MLVALGSGSPGCDCRIKAIKIDNRMWEKNAIAPAVTARVALQPREGTELSGRVMAAASEGRRQKALLVEPGWFADTLISLEAREAGGRKSILYLLEEREEKELVRKIILCYSLKLDFLCH